MQNKGQRDISSGSIFNLTERLSDSQWDVGLKTGTRFCYSATEIWTIASEAKDMVEESFSALSRLGQYFD